MTDDRTRPRGAIEKAFALLAELQSAGEAVRLSELGRRLDLPKSTAHRTLRILVESGLVAQVGNHYQAVFSHRDNALEPVDPEVCRQLMPYVCEVMMRTGMTASIAVLNGAEVLFPYRAYAHDNTRTASDYSGRGCAYTTAAGQLLLASDQSAVRRSIAARVLDASAVANLNAGLSAIRRHCFATRTSADGFTCVAVPLLGARGLPRLALTVRGENRRLDVDRAVYVLRRVAHAATAAVLGSTGAYATIAVTA